MQLKGHTLEPLPALDKKKIQQGQMEKQPVKAKDNRNLYLAKEGGITDSAFFIRSVLGILVFKVNIVIFSDCCWYFGGERCIQRRYGEENAVRVMEK